MSFPDLAHLEPPDLAPEPGWEPAPDLGIYRPERSFVSGEPEGDRLRIRYYLEPGERRFVGKVWFGPMAQGPPLCAHGGSIAAVLDDAMGRAAWVAGHKVLAGRISIDFRKKCVLGRVHHVETDVVEVDARKVRVTGRLHREGAEVAEGEGVFVIITVEYFEEEKRRLEAMGIEFPTGKPGQ